jgi:enoyl-CoA hydratase/carnithine racemase
MPGSAGVFLALTGASINAADAIYTGIADRFIASEHKDTVVRQLLAQHWQADSRANHSLVRHTLRPFAEQSIGAWPAGQVEPHMATINALCDGDSVHDIIDNITSQSTEDPWLSKARDSLAHGSSLAARWIYQQLRETRHASLREVFQLEIQLATNIMRHPEFAEGVRALLIDKDRQPTWQYASSRDVTDEVLAPFFSQPWPENPLADLD